MTEKHHRHHHPLFSPALRGSTFFAAIVGALVPLILIVSIDPADLHGATLLLAALLLLTSVISAVIFSLWLLRSGQLHQATEELRRSEEQTARILNDSSEVIFQLDADGCWQFLNPAWEAISGHGVRQSLGRPLTEFLLPADQEQCRSDVRAVAERRERSKLELRILTPSGDIRWLEAHVRPTDDGQGTITGIAGTMVDVSQSREAEERFCNTFEQAAVGIAHVRPDGSIIRANQRLCGILGMTTETLRSGSVFTLVHPDDETFLRHHYQQLLQGRDHSRSLELRCRRGDGSPLWITLTSSLVTGIAGEPDYVIDVIEDISARHQAQEAMRQSEARALSALRQLSFHMEHMPLGCIIVGKDRRITYWNPAAEAIFGWTAAEAMERSLLELLMPEEYRYFIEDAWLRLLDGEGTRSAVLESRHRYGPPLSCEWHGTTLGTDGGQTGTMCMVNDISERTRFEKCLHKVTKGVAATVGAPFFISLVQHLSDALEMEIALVGELLPDREGSIRTIGLCVDGVTRDPMTYDLAGTPCQKVIGRHLLIYEQGVQRFFPPDHPLAKMGAESYAGVPLFNDAGVPIGILVVMGRSPMIRRQITETLLQIFASRAGAELERRRSDQALRQSEERFSEIFNQNEDALALVQRHPLRLMATNPAARQLFGVDSAELGRWRPWRFLGRRAFLDLYERLQDGASGSSVFMERACHRRADGTTITLSVRLQLLTLGNETVLFCNLRDISERVRLEEEMRATQARLIHTNKMASLGLLISSISHEVNNPNNYISVNAQTLADVWHDAAPLLEECRQRRGEFPLAGIPAEEMIPLTERLIGGIAEGSRRISAIVSTMRDYVKTDAGHLREGFSLNRIIDNALAILWHLVRKNTDNLQLELAPDLPPLHGNPQQIEQVIINLVVNALQSLPDRRRGVHIATALLPERHSLLLTIRDEGHGMERQVLERLLEPFFTTKGEQGGTGLGLYISSSILQEHGATLSFESAPGKGTTATVTLPLRRANEQRVPALLPEHPPV